MLRKESAALYWILSIAKANQAILYPNFKEFSFLKLRVKMEPYMLVAACPFSRSVNLIKIFLN